MAVLLLYTLQLAVNTVKGPPPPLQAPASVHVRFFLFAGALPSSPASPRLWRHPEPGGLWLPVKAPSLGTRSRA